MTHPTDKLRERFEAFFQSLPEEIRPQFDDKSYRIHWSEIEHFITSEVETAIKDRESAGRVTKINGKTYVEINGVVDEIEIISNAQVHRLSLHTDTNSKE